MTTPKTTIERWVVERSGRSDTWHWQAEFCDEHWARNHLVFMKTLVPDATFRLVRVVSTHTVLETPA